MGGKMKRVVCCIICMSLIACSKNILREKTQLPREELTEEFPLIFDYHDIGSINFNNNENICNIHSDEIKKTKSKNILWPSFMGMIQL
jgi:hypothetical protein